MEKLCFSLDEQTLKKKTGAIRKEIETLFSEGSSHNILIYIILQIKSNKNCFQRVLITTIHTQIFQNYKTPNNGTLFLNTVNQKNPDIRQVKLILLLPWTMHSFYKNNFTRTWAWILPGFKKEVRASWDQRFDKPYECQLGSA